MKLHRVSPVVRLVILAALAVPGSAYAQTNCNTALSRIAKSAADRAVEENQDKACAGLKQGPFAIDKTTALRMEKFKVCEDGPVVTAELSAFIECATSDKAVIPVKAADTLFAKATANLDTCVVSDVKVWANGDLTKVGLSFANATEKLKEAAIKEIGQYCVKK